eukprot:1082330-Rhodomonas_salina.1
MPDLLVPDTSIFNPRPPPSVELVRERVGAVASSTVLPPAKYAFGAVKHQKTGRRLHSRISARTDDLCGIVLYSRG